ncbi:MAG TPA: heme-binding protein [Burkholderiaceae bacterium]
MKITLHALALAGLLASLVAHAQAPAASAPQTPPAPPARGIPADLALEAAKTALDTCKGLDQKVGVSVLDSAGELRLLLSSDGAPNRGVQNGALKAKAALAFEIPSGQVAERAKADTAIAAKLAANPTWLARAGAVPVTVGGTLIGAIGVGGARGSEKDEACAVAGLEKIRGRLY